MSGGPDGFVADAAGFARLPAEVALRLLGRAIGQAGSEGPVELGKLETLHAVLENALTEGIRFRRTLAGAVVTLSGGKIVVERAPPRRNARSKAAGKGRSKALTKGRPGRAKAPEKR
jgi:tRNA(Ile)-lysidine synthase